MSTDNLKQQSFKGIVLDKNIYIITRSNYSKQILPMTSFAGKHDCFLTCEGLKQLHTIWNPLPAHQVTLPLLDSRDLLLPAVLTELTATDLNKINQ